LFHSRRKFANGTAREDLPPPSEMIRAVVDTNVYVSALVFGGKPAAVIQLAEAGAFQLVASAEIREELLAPSREVRLVQ